MFWKKVINNVTYYTGSITCVSDVTRLSGTIYLYDETSDYYVDSWNIDLNDYMYSFSKSASVISGHEYTLYMEIDVYSASGYVETVTQRVSKNN